MQYLLLLGNTPKLSLAEIRAVLDSKAKPVLETVAQAESNLAPKEVVDRLGGTIKVLKIVGKFAKEQDQEQVKDLIINQFKKEAKDKKLNFYVAQIGEKSRPRIDLNQIKTKLTQLGIKSRYSPGRRIGLSAAKLLHQEVVELNLVYTQKELILTKTIAVQDIDLWTKRDRHRPYTQRKKGMLPLKVARMMVNLAVGQDKLKKAKLLDPFIGSGSTLIEAAMIGINYLIGADIDKKATQGARENLRWLKEVFDLKFDYEVHHQDATKLNLTTKVNYLVSEPFLGKQTPDIKKIRHVYLGLEKLYWGAFKNFTHLLAPGAKVVVVFPAWPSRPELDFSALIDKLSQIGYTNTLEPLSYGRKKAQVERKIWQFSYKG